MTEREREERDRAAARFLRAWRRDTETRRCSRVSVEAKRILSTFGSASNPLWPAACWAQSAVRALKEHGLDAAEQDLAMAAAVLELATKRQSVGAA